MHRRCVAFRLYRRVDSESACIRAGGGVRYNDADHYFTQCSRSATPAMFSLLNRLTHFSPSVLVHLEGRLGCSPALQDLTFLRSDEADPDCVVLATWKRGVGVIRRSFPAALMRVPALVRVLNREIDSFLDRCAPEREVPAFCDIADETGESFHQATAALQ